MSKWDVGFGKWGGGKSPRIGFVFPAPLGTALQEAGYNRGWLEITQEGLLIRPYHSDQDAHPRHREHIELPAWKSEEPPE